MRNICILDSCSNVAHSYGLCFMHWKRKNKNGDPFILSEYEIKRKITKETYETALINKADFYITGIACSRGHFSRKFTKNRRCEACYLEDIDNAPRARKYALRANYDISPEEYSKMHKSQNGLCALCEKPEKRILRGKITQLCVDHCHKTGKIRKLLCSQCNKAIGLLNHDTNLLKKAALYCD